jgi:hypothetical protein
LKSKVLLSSFTQLRGPFFKDSLISSAHLIGVANILFQSVHHLVPFGEFDEHQSALLVYPELFVRATLSGSLWLGQAEMDGV